MARAGLSQTMYMNRSKKTKAPFPYGMLQKPLENVMFCAIAEKTNTPPAWEILRLLENHRKPLATATFPQLAQHEAHDGQRDVTLAHPWNHTCPLAKPWENEHFHCPALGQNSAHHRRPQGTPEKSYGYWKIIKNRWLQQHSRN